MARTISPAVAHTRARVAAKTRDVRAGVCPESDLVDAQRDHNAARAADYIERVLAAAPELTDEQRSRLAELLRPARRKAGAA
jgi:hypothetical protein